MPTEAQIAANRENAKASTGPRTGEGKTKSAGNSRKFGLFATNNCVQPDETEEYDYFCTSLWGELTPLGAIEEVTAAEYVRNAWRLRRCAMAEERLGAMAGRVQKRNNEQCGFNRPAGDPVVYDECLPSQVAVDRARTSAYNGMRRAKADLDKIQAERRPAGQPLKNEAKIALAPEPAAAKTSQSEPANQPSTPRNAPCPCRSGLKFKRCCGIGASGAGSQPAKGSNPAVLQNAA